jgi:Zn-dependent metalloprotease
VKRLDVHLSSGVANHFFFLLAHGSQIDALSENEASPLMNGVTGVAGIGNDKAARIWYKALTTYMTSSTSYVNTKAPSNTARAATLSAARDLYGLNSVEYNTVALAWKAVNCQ